MLYPALRSGVPLSPGRVGLLVSGLWFPQVIEDEGDQDGGTPPSATLLMSIDYSGLRNLLPYSDSGTQSDTTLWSHGASSSFSSVAMDNPIGADDVFGLTITGGTPPQGGVGILFNHGSGTPITVSFYAKAGTSSSAWALIGTSGRPVTFDLSAGTITFNPASLTASITNAGGGWWLCEFTDTPTSASTSDTLTIYATDIPTSPVGSVGGTIYLCGVQAEYSSTRSSYNSNPLTAGTLNNVSDTVDRSIGSAVGSDANDPVYGPTGLVYDGVDDYALTNNLTTGFTTGSFTWSITRKNSATNRSDGWLNWLSTPRLCFLGSPSQGPQVFVADGSLTVSSDAAGVSTHDGAWHQYVMSYDSGSHTFKFYVDGALVSTKVATLGVDITAANCFQIGGYAASTAGTISTVKAWDGVLSDDDIASNYTQEKALLAGRGITLP